MFFFRRDEPPPLIVRRRFRRGTSSVTQSTSPASSPVAATTPPAAPTPPAARTPPSDVIQVVENRKEDLLATQASMCEEGDSASSNSLTVEQLNNLVLEGRYVGLARSTGGASSSSSAHYPLVHELMEQIKTKDTEIEFLKNDNAEIRVELQQNRTTMEQNNVLTQTLLQKFRSRFGEDF
ncbi:hypothetical protein YC2023_008214 [Brassica napus]